MTITLTDLQKMEKGQRKNALKRMSDEEKLSIVDQIIDRDAEIWKQYNREHYCDFGYYFRFIDGGFALSEKQR